MNNTLRYGFWILEVLAERGGDCSTSELAVELGLSKSQVSRVLKTLTEIGYITQNPKNKQYFINLSILKLSHNQLAKMKQRHVIRPYMQELVDTFDQISVSSVPVGLEAIVCDVIYPRSRTLSAVIMGQIGAVNDPYTTATGKVCAAYLSEEQIEELLKKTPPTQRTPKSLVTREDILAEYAEIRRTGIGYTREERRLQAYSVSAPIFGPTGQLLATIGITLPDGTPSKAMWSRYENAIFRASQGASFALGYPIQ